MADPVRPLLLIAGAEALAGLALFVAVVVAVLGGGAEGLSGGGTGLVVAEVVIWLLLVAGLGLIWFGLYRRRLLARTPFLLVQAFVLVLVPLFWGSDLVAYRLVAAVLAALAVTGIVLGLRPSVRAALSSARP
jgi:hypothetical protein